MTSPIINRRLNPSLTGDEKLYNKVSVGESNNNQLMENKRLELINFLALLMNLTLDIIIITRGGEFLGLLRGLIGGAIGCVAGALVLNPVGGAIGGAMIAQHKGK